MNFETVPRDLNLFLLKTLAVIKERRQFLTRISTSNWFLAMLKISTEHGSVVPVRSCVSETVNNIDNIKRKVVLVILYRNSSATFAWA